uniref:Uncharacterized protein n=1 Tax=Oreochromis aureus TaxID=47969 RepID=A0AAZ1XT70_OREAU
MLLMRLCRKQLLTPHTCFSPAGQTGGDTGGSVGLIVGLIVPALLLVAAGAGFLIYRKHKQQNRDFN